MRFILMLWLMGCTSFSLKAQLFIEPATQENDPSDLVRKWFAGSGIRITEVKWKGNLQAFATFTDSLQSSGFSSGLLVSTGLAEHAAGPNARPNAGANFGQHFFTDEDLITKTPMCDGAVIEILFIPEFDSLHFQYVFASEEYPEFVNKEFNDVFAFFLRALEAPGTRLINLARLPGGQQVMVNNVNHLKNKTSYIANDYPASSRYEVLEYDGLTIPLTASSRVVPGRLYSMKILIADLGDCEYDSGVFLKLHSFCSSKRVSEKVDLPAPVSVNYYFNFDTNLSTLPESEQEKLNMLADSILHLSLKRITIIGHTDITGIESKNRELSLQRAQRIARELTRRGVDARKIKCIGKGSARPLVANNSKKGRALNRRVELLFYSK